MADSLTNMAEKKFISIWIDGATDSSVTENELIHIRFVDDSVPVIHCLSCENLKNAHSAGVKQAIETATESQ